jgi:PIN domain nuclease of toxin-antitoxin system
MKLLLDAHAFIWWDDNPQRLGSAAQAACFDVNNALFVSAATLWELQVKTMIGKLTLRRALKQMVSDQEQRNGLQILPVTAEHVYQLSGLPSYHKDPFDRLLVAQAQIEGCHLVTQDREISRYPVQIVW